MKNNQIESKNCFKIISYNMAFEIGGTNTVVSISKKSNLKNIINDFNLNENTESITETKLFKFKTGNDPEKLFKEIHEKIDSNIDLTKSSINKVGISCFGPLGLNKNKSDYGFILNTPKKGWIKTNILEYVSYHFKVSKNDIVIETDVNAAALLEIKNEIEKKSTISNLAYITIGTGCGIGLVVDKNLVHGMLHPEGGHIRVNRHKLDNFKGVCIYHNDCAEGLITNVSIAERLNLVDVDDVSKLKDNDEIWEIIAFYIAQVCINLTYLVSVEKIIIGGGIINRNGLIEKVRKHMFTLNNNYIDVSQLSEEGLNSYIIRSEFFNNCGILSAYSLIVD